MGVSVRYRRAPERLQYSVASIRRSLTEIENLASEIGVLTGLLLNKLAQDKISDVYLLSGRRQKRYE